MTKAFDLVVLESGQTLSCHPLDSCFDMFCSVHNPSRHLLAHLPRRWSQSRYLMERVCEHGYGHPDPDDLAYKSLYLDAGLIKVAGTHTCCGCCIPKKEKNLNTLLRPRLIMTKGLPGSGKSTWAREQVRAGRRGGILRVNKDDLRAMLHDDRFGGPTEKRTLDARDALVSTFLAQGKAVIVDDTNLNPIHEERLRELAKEFRATFEIKDFCDVPIEVCIKQDLQRAKSVGEQVIRREHAKWFSKYTEPAPEYNPRLRDVVLVDIDGTVARMVNRKPFEWHKVGDDVRNEPVVRLVQSLFDAGDVEIVFLSGRDSVCRRDTRDWLGSNIGSWTFDCRLYMRPEGDNRKDAVVKEEIYRAHIAGRANVRFILDDRDQVVEMWRSLGLPCFQVAPGAF